MGSSERATGDGSDPVVVIVDDDAEVLGALKFALEVEGFSVVTYRSGSELLAEPDLPGSGCLVIDHKLAGMDGLDLLAALRRRKVRLPAVLITSHPSLALRRRAAAETTLIVEKPLLGDHLANAIRSMMAGETEPLH